MFKSLIIIACLLSFAYCQESYTTATIGADHFLKISLHQDIDNVIISILSSDESSLSAYLLDTSDFISDYSSNDFSKGDVLNGYCTDFLQCNTTATLDPNLDYVLVVKNNNILFDSTFQYSLTTNTSSVLLAWFIIIGAILVVIAIVAIILTAIILAIKKC